MYIRISEIAERRAISANDRCFNSNMCLCNMHKGDISDAYGYLMPFRFSDYRKEWDSIETKTTMDACKLSYRFHQYSKTTLLMIGYGYVLDPLQGSTEEDEDDTV